MKNLLLISSLLLLIAGCSVVGRNPSPPTKLEQGIFTVTTNYVTEMQTNVATQVTAGVTNWVTNVVSQIIPQYSYAKGSGGQAAQDTVTAIGNLFGVGGVAGTAVSGLLALWGYLRSSKNYTTAANTAQVVETLRQFIKALPNGQAYDAALTQFMTQHQSEAGVIANVIQILGKEVSNPDAQVAAREVINSLRQLGVNIPTPPQ